MVVLNLTMILEIVWFHCNVKVSLNFQHKKHKKSRRFVLFQNLISAITLTQSDKYMNSSGLKREQN